MPLRENPDKFKWLSAGHGVQVSLSAPPDISQFPLRKVKLIWRSEWSVWLCTLNSKNIFFHRCFFLQGRLSFKSDFFLLLLLLLFVVTLRSFQKYWHGADEVDHNQINIPVCCSAKIRRFTGRTAAELKMKFKKFRVTLFREHDIMDHCSSRAEKMGIHLFFGMLTNEFYPYTDHFLVLSVLFSLDIEMKSQKGHARFDTETVIFHLCVPRILLKRCSSSQKSHDPYVWLNSRTHAPTRSDRPLEWN